MAKLCPWKVEKKLITLVYKWVKDEISKTVLWKVSHRKNGYGREITNSKILLIHMDNQTTQRGTI